MYMYGQFLNSNVVPTAFGGAIYGLSMRRHMFVVPSMPWPTALKAFTKLSKTMEC